MNIELETIRHRIAALRVWRGENDQDAILMSEMLEEIRRLKDQKSASSENV